MQNVLLDLELMVVVRVLVMTTAAAQEIGAGRRDTACRGRNQVFQMGPGKSRFLLNDRGFDLLFGQNKGKKDSFAAAAGVGGEMSQAVAAINQLFNGEKQ